MNALKGTAMKMNLLPRVQLGLVVLFALAALAGPLLFRQFEAVIALVAVFGLALGAVTVWIGWLAAVRKQRVEYPFAGWSRAVMQPFLSPREQRALREKARKASAARQTFLGYANLAVGSLLVIALLAALLIVLLD